MKTRRPFRFVHASDLHLEQPPFGVVEVPEHLRDLLVTAAYTAAQRVFQTAIAEEAALVVLAGDVLHAERCGPRGPLFLIDQFARLAERGIGVYWAGGSVDPPEAWPAALDLPDNVHRFPRGQLEQFVHRRDGAPLARLAGASRDRQRPVRPADYELDADGLLTIGVAFGGFDAAALPPQGADYWALGGRHDRRTLATSPQVAHYPGSPQGRRPEEAGIHGCTLVQVEEDGQIRTSLIPTDAVRWLSERVEVDPAMTREGLDGLLRQRMSALQEANPRMDLLLKWTVAGDGPLMGQMRRASLAGELLAGLRSEFGAGPPAAWSLSLDVEPTGAMPPEWYEQDTIRGEFLRAVRQLEMNPGEPLGLERYLSESQLAGTLAALLSAPDAAARQRALREASLLGADLLSGEDQ